MDGLTFRLVIHRLETAGVFVGLGLEVGEVSRAELADNAPFELDRQLLLLRFVEQMSLREMSEVLGAPELALKMQLHRARQRFREAVSTKQLGVST